VKFIVEKASDIGIKRKPKTVEFDTLKTLMEFVEKYDKVIIYSNNKIVIYNDYVE